MHPKKNVAGSPRLAATRALLSLGMLTTVFGVVGCAPALGGNPSPSDAGSSAEGKNADTNLSGELTIYAAASLQEAFDTLSTEFAEQHPEITFAPIVYNGSSTLAVQLSAGAPADIFASADTRTMQLVVDDGLAANDPHIFATNSLVIAVAPGNPLGLTSLDDLTKSSNGQQPVVVLCAPEVPCGNASREILTQNDVAVTPASEEQSVSAVLAKVKTGEADAGLVYRTDVLSAAGSVDSVDIEGATKFLNEYPIALLADSQSPEAARAFSDFVRSTEGASILESIGFGIPQ